MPSDPARTARYAALALRYPSAVTYDRCTGQGLRAMREALDVLEAIRAPYDSFDDLRPEPYRPRRVSLAARGMPDTVGHLLTMVLATDLSPAMRRECEALRDRLPDALD